LRGEVIEPDRYKNNKDKLQNASNCFNDTKGLPDCELRCGSETAEQLTNTPVRLIPNMTIGKRMLKKKIERQSPS